MGLEVLPPLSRATFWIEVLACRRPISAGPCDLAAALAVRVQARRPVVR
jgi:hypothetical protein